MKTISIATRLGRTRAKGGGVNISWAEWIAGLTETQVMDVDFGQTDRHWQTPDGLALADDAGENIGFASDSAMWGGRNFADEMAAQADVMSFATVAVVNFGGSSGSWTAGTKTVANTVIGSDASYPRLLLTQSTSLAGYYRYTVTLGTPSPANIGRIAITNGGSNPTASGQTPGIVRFPNVANQRVELGFDGRSTWSTTLNFTIRKIAGNHGVQATASLQGKRQAGGVCRYDGTDDNHLTTFLAQSGAMTLLDHGTIDAVISATQMFLGASGASVNRCWLAVTTAGYIAAGVGSDSTSTIVGTKDVRGKTIVAALAFDGATVKLFLRVDGATTEEYSAAQASTPTTTIPFRIGAYNNNGTAAGFAKVDAKRIAAAHKLMTFAEFRSIAAKLAA